MAFSLKVTLEIESRSGEDDIQLDDAPWMVVFHGIADAWLRPFDADGWRLRHGNLRVADSPYSPHLADDVRGSMTRSGSPTAWPSIMTRRSARSPACTTTLARQPRFIQLRSCRSQPVHPEPPATAGLLWDNGGVSWSPGPTCWPAATLRKGGRSPARPCSWRPACPGSSPAATSVADR